MLFVPVIILVAFVNYKVDVSGIFQGKQFEREIAEALLQGKGVSHYEKLDEREIMRVIALHVTEPYETVALGSSRVLQLTGEIAGSDSFFNAGMIGADFRDILGTFYQFDKQNILPKNLIIGLDPWILNGDTDEAWDARANNNLYLEFLNEALGYDVSYAAEDNKLNLKALFDTSYFQGNINELKRDKSKDNMPVIVEPKEFCNQNTETKMPDGTLLYTDEFRNRTQEEVDFSAIEQVYAATLLRVHNFTELNYTFTQQFEKFVKYAQDKGVNVIFLLTPYHPICYNGATEKFEEYEGLFLAEQYFKYYAKLNGIQCIGSYNPFALNSQSSDFYDGIHIKGEGIAKFFDSSLIKADAVGPVDDGNDLITNTKSSTDE